MIEGPRTLHDSGMYRRADPGMSILSYDQYLSDGYASPSYTKRDTPIPELEPKPGPPRKRVPVACERCRKRKIKCSGDQGDGTGCDNCKSAGWDGCAFLRVKSENLHYHGPSRVWGHHQSHRFHPYGSSAGRHQHYLPQHHGYNQHLHPAYATWSKDYSNVANAAANMTWSPAIYPSTYADYGNESASPYSHPPSYILPDLDNHGRSAMYMGQMARPQHSMTLWSDAMNSMSVPQQMSSIYPAAPIETMKAYNLTPNQHVLSNERILPTPPTLSGVVSLPSQDGETPPHSAVSHRSSHTWDSSTGSHTSSNSSRTSCGTNQDGGNNSDVQTALVPCDDPNEPYIYTQNINSPQISVPASALPIATESSDASQLEDTQSTGIPEPAEMVIRNRSVGDKTGIASPAGLNELYGYSSTTRRSSRRAQDMLHNLLTSGFSGSGPWTASPTSSTRHGSFGNNHQTFGNPEHYALQLVRSPSVPLDSRPSY